MPAADYPPINYRPYPLVQEIIARHEEALDFKAELKLFADSLPKVNLPSTLGAIAGLAAGAGVVQMSDWVVEATSAAGAGLL